MKSFPRININRAEYEQELARHLHDPFNFRMTKVFWHGSADLAEIIEHEGFETYRSDLQLVRVSIQQHRDQIATLRAVVAKMDARATECQRAARSAETEPKFHRDARHGQLVKTDRTNEINLFEHGMNEARKQADAANIAASRIESELKRLQEADARLSAGLMACLAREQEKADTPAAPPPAPVINVQVAAPEVHLEAQIKMPPVQIAEVAITSLPDRKTTTTIERNTAGDITKSEQVESDA